MRARTRADMCLVISDSRFGLGRVASTAADTFSDRLKSYSRNLEFKNLEGWRITFFFGYSRGAAR